ncbi:type II secretion system protein [Psychrobacillus sp. FSL H8-0484]|uniref:PulJ/GspJ family protein n=1 Tax=Psychrobacillus sp. FSL H8-0484 TaxID=2921390 RepID=UPI0030FC4F6F
MLNNIKNKNGFTLIEILASVVLLTIVISMFLSIFPQMANMNNRTGDNLDAANVGKELLVLVKKNAYTSFLNNDSNLIIKTTIRNLTKKEDLTSSIIYEGTYDKLGQTFFIKIQIKKIGEFPPPDQSQFHQLHQVIIDVDVKEIKTDSPTLTTTYGYIKGN